MQILFFPQPILASQKEWPSRRLANRHEHKTSQVEKCTSHLLDRLALHLTRRRNSHALAGVMIRQIMRPPTGCPSPVWWRLTTFLDCVHSTARFVLSDLQAPSRSRDFIMGHPILARWVRHRGKSGRFRASANPAWPMRPSHALDVEAEVRRVAGPCGMQSTGRVMQDAVIHRSAHCFRWSWPGVRQQWRSSERAGWPGPFRQVIRATPARGLEFCGL